MTFRSSFLLVAILALAGCSTAAEAEEPTAAASADAVVSNDILERTILKGKVAVGETSKVAYEPDLYRQAQIDGVPYLAWEIVSPASAFDTATITVGVVGDFPGDPDVLVVDASFAVLGEARGTATELGDEATLTIDASKGAKFVLVRDMHWVAPMEFDITLAR
ncbi:MAG: hypothetical protein KIT84_17310 [Labilithrix sp.]|nr:hypothetical protein [Labilithrix sp.]MCW5812790.1 hypothetical protein [Labilithrix sp.]